MKVPGAGVVSGVRPGSLADEAGIEAGDAVVAVAGITLRDVVDYQFHQADEEVSVHIRKANGLDDLILFEKEPDEDIGIEFERPTWDDVTLCNNNCFFCFLKGLPKGMRKTLYMKDDDYRLSFLHGNFVTMTNLEESDWQRLEEQRLSPLNVSVHATETTLRRQMLVNDTAPDICEQLRRMGELGIEANTQIVLCPGVNDGDNLRRSLRDLTELFPIVRTVSVVPVGASPKLEDWSLNRDGIELVRPTPEYARAVIGLIAPFQREMRKRAGSTVVQCSDEYYVTAGVPIPGEATYDGFPQYENGIGMVRTMLRDWGRTRRRLRSRPLQPAVERVAIATGLLAAPILADVAAEFSEITGVAVRVVPVVNHVFGERVNVSGLLCGRDYVNALRDVDVDMFILPRPSLDYFGKQFLDSMTIEEVEVALSRPLAFASQWSEVAKLIERGAVRPTRNEAPNGAFWSEPATV